MTARILCIEDDPDIARAIELVLQGAGFEVTGAADGREGLRIFHNGYPDVVLLDVGLPTLDGWEVLARIREASDVPVLLLTAAGQLTDKVRGLHHGADDYLTKPFANAILVARVRALLRRPRSGRPQAEVYDDGRVQVTFGSERVLVDDQSVELTPGEVRLLAALVRNAGQTLSADQLREQAWSDPSRTEQPAPGTAQLAGAVERLSRKLGAVCASGSPIEAIPGSGYRYLRPPDDPPESPARAGPPASSPPGRPAPPADEPGRHQADHPYDEGGRAASGTVLPGPGRRMVDGAEDAGQ